jgi:hypothetical protein
MDSPVLKKWILNQLYLEDLCLPVLAKIKYMHWTQKQAALSGKEVSIPE